MKKTFRTAMFSTIAMLIVGVMSLTGVTYAWFTQGTTANVTGMSMSVVAADGGLQISTTKDSGYANKLELTNAELTDIEPVSSTDAKNFFAATPNEENSNEIKTTKIDTTKITDYVWIQDLYVKNTGYDNIVVDLSTTAFVDVDKNENRAAEAAAKLAVFTVSEAGEETLQYIYSQGTDTYKGVTEASGDDYFNISTGFVGESTSKSYIASPENFKTKTAECTFTIKGGDVVGGVLQETVVHIKVVVWLEGQDQDCVNKNAASTFGLDLVFNATKAAS